MGPAASLFGQDYPPGFRYCEDFLSPTEETALLDSIANVTFGAFAMRGVVARRRVAFFGQSYDRTEARPFPEFLLSLRIRVGEWTGIDATAFAMCLINEYPPGAPIGWHRDAPQHDVVAGLSLRSACRMKFRRYLSPALAAGKTVRRPATHEIALEPRSAYFMTGESRNSYEHHIPPVSDLRYSVTFRTLR